jgi:hypothetical protein
MRHHHGRTDSRRPAHHHAAKQVEPEAESGVDRARGAQRDPRGGQLQRERKSVEAEAQLGGIGLRLGEREARPGLRRYGLDEAAVGLTLDLLDVLSIFGGRLPNSSAATPKKPATSRCPIPPPAGPGRGPPASRWRSSPCAWACSRGAGRDCLAPNRSSPGVHRIAAHGIPLPGDGCPSPTTGDGTKIIQPGATGWTGPDMTVSPCDGTSLRVVHDAAGELPNRPGAFTQLRRRHGADGPGCPRFWARRLNAWQWRVSFGPRTPCTWDDSFRGATSH